MSENINDYVIIEEEPESWFNKLKNYPITYYIVAVNVLVFLAIHLSNFLFPDISLVDILVKNTYSISIDGQFYRLFTAIFSHYSVTHLFFNCFAIIILGQHVEQIFGKLKFVIIFIIAGLFGSLFSFMFSPNPALGASGGVFGIFGVHLYLYMKNKTAYSKIFGQEIFKLLVINVIIGFVVPNIDYWGHFGGIVGGFLATNALGLKHTIKFNRNKILISIVTVVLFIGSFVYIDNNYENYANNVDVIIDKANYSINANNLSLLKESREELVNITPLLPPIYEADSYLEQIDEFIIKLQEN